MTAVRALLKDRRRSQRGSVLSGVLIMTAFIAIISGALMTLLSGSFLLSRDLMNQAENEATVNSSIELSLNRLQGTQLYYACPALNPVSLNNRTAVPALASCWPDVREAQKFRRLGGGSVPFYFDGAHAQANGLNEYVVGDSRGNVFDYPFGSTASRWTLSLAGTLTASPLVIGNPSVSGQLVDIFPMQGSACSPSANCIDVRSDNNSSSPPSQRCTIAASFGPVVSTPGAGAANAGFVYYGDGSQLQVSDLSGVDCDAISSVTIPGNQPVAAGPVAFQCTGGCGNTSDEVYAVASNNTSSRLVWYRYGNGLSSAGSLPLPWANVAGIAASGTSLPASLAITFAGGGIALVQLASNGTMTSLTTSVASATARSTLAWVSTGEAGSRRLLPENPDSSHAISTHDDSMVISHELQAEGPHATWPVVTTTGVIRRTNA